MAVRTHFGLGRVTTTDIEYYRILFYVCVTQRIDTQLAIKNTEVTLNRC